VNTHVTVVGNATREPELRYTQGGMPVASFGVAVSERTKNRDTGEWEDGEPSFYDVTCFRLLAESVAEAVAKGQRVIVTGALKQSRWEKDGDKRSKVELLADDVGTSVLFASRDTSSVAPRSRPVSDEPF
jgi:single-strand DNA-binding protein